MKKDLKIFFSEDSDLVELEMKQKQWRGDVLVQLGNDLYKVAFITLERLSNEYKISKENDNPYILHSMMIVYKIDKQTIIASIVKAYERKMLPAFRKVDLAKEYKHTFPELADISNWVQVY